MSNNRLESLTLGTGESLQQLLHHRPQTPHLLREGLLHPTKPLMLLLRMLRELFNVALGFPRPVPQLQGRIHTLHSAPNFCVWGCSKRQSLLRPFLILNPERSGRGKENAPVSRADRCNDSVHDPVADCFVSALPRNYARENERVSEE